MVSKIEFRAHHVPREGRVFVEEFIRATETHLGSFASPGELFSVPRCSRWPFLSILRKTTVSSHPHLNPEHLARSVSVSSLPSQRD